MILATRYPPFRILCVLALIFTHASLGLADDQDDQPPKLPTEVTLTSGAILHHVSVVRWAKDRVTLKHSGGADPVRFVNMALKDREVFEAAKDYYLARQAEEDEARRNISVTIKGQAFVQTNGAGPSKLGAMRIYAFPLEALEAFKTYHDTVNLPHPLASALTDADGRFKLTVPGSDPFLIFAQGSRTLGDTTENYEWHVSSETIEDRNNLLLQNENMVEPTDKNIVIAQ